ncbi:hypothetical protein C8Q77DRAFT_1126108, partial [Trametes polyzona]
MYVLLYTCKGALMLYVFIRALSWSAVPQSSAMPQDVFGPSSGFLNPPYTWAAQICSCTPTFLSNTVSRWTTASGRPVGTKGYTLL